MKTLVFDIDLNRIHAISTDAGIVCNNTNKIPFDAIENHDRILIEVASATFYTTNVNEIRNRAKWVLFNSVTAGRIYQFCAWRLKPKIVLVSSSSLWTLGHPEPMRHAIAGVSGDNHDIRECKAMLFFFCTNPDKWVPFETYFDNLSTPRKVKRSCQKKKS